MEDPNKNDHYVLFTNLDYVTIGDVRTRTHALLLYLRDGRYRLAGFGTVPEWLVFEFELKSLEHKVTPKLIDLGNGKTRQSPCMVLTIERAGYAVQLEPMDHGQPICIEHFTAVHIDQVWETLMVRTAKYWKALSMPTLRWASAEEVRRMTEHVVEEMNKRRR